MKIESITPRERVCARAALLASGYFKNPDRESLTTLARQYYDADNQRTATDIAYLLVRGYQGEIRLA